MIPSCSLAELRVIFEDIIVQLPSILSGREDVGNGFQQHLLSRAKTHLARSEFDCVFSVLSLAAKFSSPMPTGTAPASKLAKSAARSGSAPSDPATFIRFYAKPALFSNISQATKSQLACFACDVYESFSSNPNDNRNNNRNITSVFLEVSPSLLTVSRILYLYRP